MKTKSAAPNLETLFSETHPDFQAKIVAIGKLCHLAAIKVYSLWRENAKSCDDHDQSALLWEFVQWYQPQLGAEKSSLIALV